MERLAVYGTGFFTAVAAATSVINFTADNGSIVGAILMAAFAIVLGACTIALDKETK